MNQVITVYSEERVIETLTPDNTLIIMNKIDLLTSDISIQVSGI